MDYRKFTKKQLADILDIIHASVSCRDEKQMEGLLDSIGSLVSGDFSVCGIGKGDAKGLSETPKVINGSYPWEWLKIYGERELYYNDPIIWHNFQYPGAQLWDQTYELFSGKISRDFISMSRDFGLCGGVSGGLFYKGTGLSTIFTFSGKEKAFDGHQKEIMSVLSPHLHQALVRVYKETVNVRCSLSGREKEVMCWIREGKTNWEISMILNISERTVKFHVQNIERKLNAVNKTHAVAIALDQNLLTS